MEHLISSKENPHIKYAKKILNSSKFRKEENCFSIEGVRLCSDAFLNFVKIKEVFYTQDCLKKFQENLNPIINGAKAFLVTENIIKSITDTDSPQGIVCICENKNFECDKFFQKDMFDFEKAIILENIQNPSNLGSILRTCDALKLNTVFITGKSCDIYNPKVLRGSMGAVFRLRILEFGSTIDVVNMLKACGFRMYATVPDDNAVNLKNVDFQGKCGIILGNEGNGIELESIKSCDEKITIPMNKNSESLNVSVAAGISIWEMMNCEKHIKNYDGK